MDDLVFRRAGKTDLPHILAMQADIFHGEQGIPDDDVGAFLQKRPICWCAGSGGVLCAAAAAWQEGSETHWGRFVVLPGLPGAAHWVAGWRGSRLTTCLRWALTASTWTPARRRSASSAAWAGGSWASRPRSTGAP